MSYARQIGLALALLACIPAARAAEPDIKPYLTHPIIGPQLAMSQVQDYCESRVPDMPKLTTAAEWEKLAARIRADVLDKVVFRGQARSWRDAKCKVEWLDVIEGGPGYTVRKLRYEALPGLWIPALLYEPEKLSGKVPSMLAVNGHEVAGKAVGYKQIRCINLAKRGMLVLNVEWLGMGQLSGPEYQHYKMNQLDLCGTSGLAPFYLAMSRAIDLLLAHEHADPTRLAVSGLSGGGWQTIFISSLDTRVTLCNPVAGYSSFKTRARNLSDLGDSEQTPSDLATVADYTHLTAMRAPRPTLLTFNSKDDCCFASPHALAPLMDAAGPVFKLFDKPDSLRSHVNDVPGTHNYEKDNRQAFYKMVGDHFYAGKTDFSADEIPSDKEVKSREALTVPLPADNATFNTLAKSLAKNLPRDIDPLTEKAELTNWQRKYRPLLRDLVHYKEYKLKAAPTEQLDKDGLHITYWKLDLTLDRDADWTVPAVEISPAKPSGTTLLILDAGRAAAADHIKPLLAAGRRVIAIDPFYFGESKIEKRDFLFALLVAAVGERPIGIQASQIAAIARWAKEKYGEAPTLQAVGPRSSTIALIAAALEEKSIAGLELHNSLSSLHDIINQNRSVDQMPEMFCFGLLERLDIPQLATLVAPRPIKQIP